MQPRRPDERRRRAQEVAPMYGHGRTGGVLHRFGRSRCGMVNLTGVVTMAWRPPSTCTNAMHPMSWINDRGPPAVGTRLAIKGSGGSDMRTPILALTTLLALLMIPTRPVAGHVAAVTATVSGVVLHAQEAPAPPARVEVQV